MQTSCGFAVPLLSILADAEKGPRGSLTERQTLQNFGRKSINYPVEMAAYRVKYNSESLDGAPGLRKAMKTDGQYIRYREFRRWLLRMSKQWDAILLGALLALILMALLQAAATVLNIRPRTGLGLG